MVGGTCAATCSGFRSLRSECIANPCLADNLCQTVASGVADCAAWCCESHTAAIFFMVLFICSGLFFAVVAYYLYQLHKENVKAGSITEDGEKIDPNVVVEKPKSERQKRLDDAAMRL